MSVKDSPLRSSLLPSKRVGVKSHRPRESLCLWPMVSCFLLGCYLTVIQTNILDQQYERTFLSTLKLAGDLLPKESFAKENDDEDEKQENAIAPVQETNLNLFQTQTIESRYQPREAQSAQHPRHLLQWNRQAIDQVCPPLGFKRPTGDDVPGKILQERNKDLSGLSANFEEDGVVGPFASSLTREDLLTVVDNLQRHQSIVQKAAKQSPHRARLHGERDILMSRCYAFDPLCEKLAQDPAVIDVVKQIIGDDIVVWEMTAFSKEEGTIQPWHTDIEPYDRCYNSMVQIWIGVDQVTENSNLEVVTKSHRMPSLTWMYPDHVATAKTSADKRSFETNVILPCATSIEPGARIVKPVTRDGDFMVLHSHAWHAAETNSKFRKAIRVSYATPDCPTGAVNKYERPDLPPLRPIASRPPVLLVSGSAHTIPQNLTVANNFLHLRKLKGFVLSPQKKEKRYNRMAKKKTTMDVQLWNREEIKAKLRTYKLKDVVRVKSDLLIGNSPLLDNIEIFETCLKPFESVHTDFDAHTDEVFHYVTEGSVAFHFMPNATLLSPEEHKLGPVPEMIEMGAGGIGFTGGLSATNNGFHNEIGGPDGGCYYNFKYNIRGNQDNHNTTDIAGLGTDWDSAGSLVQSPPLSANAVNGERFLEKKDPTQVGKVVGFMCRCAHKMHSDNDHETIFIVEHIPEDVTLYSLPDKKVIREGALLFFPLNSIHGVEARYTKNGTVVPYRKQKNFVDTPRCMVMEVWAN